MEDENIFEYGPYKLYKDAFLENLAKNMDKYIRDHRLNDPQLLQDFKDAVDFIGKGMGDYITYANGAGAFKDNRGYLTSKKLGHVYAANYANFVAHKQGALGDATSKKKKEEIKEEEKKPLFDPAKNIIGLEFERAANPLGNDSGYSMWKDGLENPVEQLRQLINTHKEGLSKYNFSGTNLTLDFYEKALNSLYTGLENGIDDEDIEKMSRLGFKNPRAFMPVQEKPTNIISTLSNDRLKLLMDDLKFTVDPTTKTWMDPSGYNTQIPATVDPENPGEGYKEQYAAWLQHTRRNTSEENIDEDTDWTEILNTVGPIALDITNLVSPEPISSAVTGLGSDIWNFINDDNRMENWKQHLTNVGLTGVSLLPYAGDFGTLGKIGSGLEKMISSKWFMPIAGSAIAYITANVGPEAVKSIYTSMDKMYNKEEMTVDDYANIGQLLLGIMEVAKSGKVFYNNLKINKAATIQGDAARVTDKKGVRHVFQGEDAKKVSELSGDELNKHLKDFGIEDYVNIETSNKRNSLGRIYNPETVRNMASLYGKRTLKHAQNVIGDDKMASRKGSTKNAPETPPNKPTKIKTVEDLRNTVKAKLQADGKSTEDIQAIDDALKSLKTGGFKSLYKGKAFFSNTKEYEEVVKLLKTKADFSEDAARKILNKIGAYKHGGILKASGGIKINAKDIDLRAYKGWDEHFNYDETNKVYSLKDGYNGEALTKWGTANGLNITLPNQTYGTDKYVYTPQSSLYKEGVTSIGFKNANNGLRADVLIKSPDGSDELDLNKHWQSRKMYLQVANKQEGTHDGAYLRRGDFLNWAKNNYEEGMTLELLLEKYNFGIDKMYGYKQSDKGITYTGRSGDGNDETEEFNINNLSYYLSQNGPALHGYDKASQRLNGSGTMGRSIDRENVIISPYTEEELKNFDIHKGNGLFDILSNNSFTNDGTGRYYVGNPDLTITKANSSEGVNGNSINEGNEGNSDGVDGSNLKGDNNSIEIAPTGEPMTKKPSRSLEPLFSAFNYYNSLRTNGKILDLTNELTPLLYDPVEHHRPIHGNLRAIVEGNKLAATLQNFVSKPLTSDGSLLTAALMDAINLGNKYREEGFKADDERLLETSEKAWLLEKENKNNRHEVAMKNRENMHQVNVTKLSAKAGKIRSDYESTKNFVDELKKYYAIKHAKDEKILDTIYARSLLQDIYKNPQNYMPGWNTYHDSIWKKGISGKQLTDVELEVFNLLKLLFTNAYYSNLYYNTTPIDTSVKDITAAASDYTWIKELARQKELKKRGGKLSKDDAKLVLEFLKESNKNYNKAMDRSARSMYNYIKLLRKK